MYWEHLKLFHRAWSITNIVQLFFELIFTCFTYIFPIWYSIYWWLVLLGKKCVSFVFLCIRHNNCENIEITTYVIAWTDNPFTDPHIFYTITWHRISLNVILSLVLWSLTWVLNISQTPLIFLKFLIFCLFQSLLTSLWNIS